jgi:hypothetical protein
LLHHGSHRTRRIDQACCAAPLSMNSPRAPSM